MTQALSSLLQRFWTAERDDLSPVLYRRTLYAVAAFGIGLRIALSLVNLEANDDHVAVIRIIAFENRMPAFTEVWEAYQPKLYHVTVAAVWRLLEIDSRPVQIRIAQLIGCTAGLLTLLVLWRFLQRVTPSRRVRLVSFSLVCLNPKLVGINAQATNDSFVILFATLALFFGYRFFNEPRARDFVWMTAFAILASITKANGMVVAIAIGTVFPFALLRWRTGAFQRPTRTVLYGAVFVVVFVLSVAILGSYWDNYRQYGSPFAINQSKSPFPNLIERTYVERPGVTSIVDAYLTFRFIDLLKNPVLSENQKYYSPKRTSVWSQLYGRTHFVHFDSHPDSWKWKHPIVLDLGRLIFIVALFPTLLLLKGVVQELVRAMQWSLRLGPRKRPGLARLLLTVAALGYLVFQVALSLQYRDFSATKAIYLFPGLLGFLLLFSEQCEWFYSRFRDRGGLCRLADLALVSLLVLYVTDSLFLFSQLARA